MVSRRFLRTALLEYLEHDAGLVRRTVAVAGASAGSLLWRRHEKSLAFRILSRVHRAGGPASTTRHIERLLSEANAQERSGTDTGLWSFYREHIRNSVRHHAAKPTLANPAMLLG
jgi:hypothetical protein